MFDRMGQILYPASAGDADTVMEAAIDSGASDVESGEDGHVIWCDFTELAEVSAALDASLGEAESTRLVWKPQTVTVNAATFFRIRWNSGLRGVATGPAFVRHFGLCRRCDALCYLCGR